MQSLFANTGTRPFHYKNIPSIYGLAGDVKVTADDGCVTEICTFIHRVIVPIIKLEQGHLWTVTAKSALKLILDH
jgi:hypothetical protein